MKKGLVFATLVLLFATAFAPTTPVFQDGNCPSAPAKLKQADIAVVTVGDGETLNLRVFPGLKQEIIVKIPAYTYVTIIAGPICDGGYRWFEVGWEGKDGWSAEVGPDGKYNMIPNGSPMPNTDSQDNNNENGNFNPFGYTPAPIFKIEAGTPYFFRDWENLQFRQIPNEDTLNALGFPKDQIDLIPGDDFIVDPSLSLGPDVPDVHNDPDEFCAFKYEHFPSYPNPFWSPCGLVFDQPLVPTATPVPLVEAPIATSEEPFFCNWWIIGWLACDLAEANSVEASANIQCDMQCIPTARQNRTDLLDRAWSNSSTANGILADAKASKPFEWNGQKWQVKVRGTNEPPQKGDLVIWPNQGVYFDSDGTKHVIGHIGYVSGNTSGNMFPITDSNWGTPAGQTKCNTRNGETIPIDYKSMKFITSPYLVPVNKCSQYQGWQNFACQYIPWWKP